MREVLNRAWMHLVVGAALLALALVFLWPIPAFLDDHVIGGDGDPLLELWTLCWNVHFLSGKAPSYFDANICHPAETSLAFADHLFAQSLLFLPLYAITGNQAMAYNLLVTLTFLLNGWGAWLCARCLGLSRPAALLSGVLFAFFPNRLFEIPHLHILSSQWLPFSFLFLLRFLRRRPGRWLDLTAFTVFSLLCILSSFYQALIWTVLVAVTVAVSICARRLDRHNLILLAGSGLVLALLTAPFAAPYFEVSARYQVIRSLEENIYRSARPGDFLSAPDTNLIYGRPPAEPPGPGDPPRRIRPLFPGLIFTLLLVCGCAVLFIPVRPSAKRQPASRELLILLLATIAALVLSFGPALPWGSGEGRTLIPLPYGLLYHWVPGIKGLRVPARMVLLFHFAGSLLAAYGLQRLLSRLRAGRVWAITLLVCALAFLEGVSLDVAKRRVETDRTMSPAYMDLRTLPDDTVLLELPNHLPVRQYMPMYTSTFHFHRLANGRSGIIPPVTRRLFRLIDPDRPYAFGPAFLDHALQTGINTILVHRSWNPMELNRLSMTRLYRQNCLEPLGRYQNRDMLYRIDAVRGRAEDLTPQPDGPFEPAAGAVFHLKNGEAFPSSFQQPMKLTAEDDLLRLGEPGEFRWLARIPQGRWQLRMWVAETGPTDGVDKPAMLTVDIAGVEVVRSQQLREGQPVRGIPLEVSTTAHYRINCLVKTGPDQRHLDLVLQAARLVPLSPAKGDKQADAESRIME